MSKTKIVHIVVTVLLLLLMVFAIVFYVADIVINNTEPTKNLFKFLAVILMCMGGLVRLLFANNKKRRSLYFYEKSYEEELGSAFSEKHFCRKKLLKAIRFYNENRFSKAIQYLTELQPECVNHDDYYAVGLFLGSTLTDFGQLDSAVEVYESLKRMNVVSPVIYSQLGRLHSRLGNYDEAIANMHLALQNDEKNYGTYSNLAKLYFDTADFENAKKYAMKALEINHKCGPAASWLAIIYSIEEDYAKVKRYSHIAISAGEDPDALIRLINHYKTLRALDEDAEYDQEFDEDED